SSSTGRSPRTRRWTSPCARSACGHTPAASRWTWSRWPRPAGRRCGARSPPTCTGPHRPDPAPKSPPGPMAASGRSPAGRVSARSRRNRRRCGGWTPASGRRTRRSPVTATRSTPPGWEPGRSGSAAGSRTACGARPVAWRSSARGCRRRTRCRSPSPRRCGCRPRSGSPPPRTATPGGSRCTASRPAGGTWPVPYGRSVDRRPPRPGRGRARCQLVGRRPPGPPGIVGTMRLPHSLPLPFATTTAAGGLYVGDGLDALCELPDDSVDLVVTSPPYDRQPKYGNGERYGVDWYRGTFLKITREIHRVLAPHGSFVLNYRSKRWGKERGTLQYELVFLLREQGYLFAEDFVWGKPSPPPGRFNHFLKDAVEYCFQFAKTPDWQFFPEQCLSPARWDRRDLARRRRLPHNYLRADAPSGQGRKRVQAGPDLVRPSTLLIFE